MRRAYARGIVRTSAVSQAKGDHIPWGWVAITAVGLEVAVTLAAFVWVGIYSYLIHPGEDLSYYQNYAQFASPIVSVVVGIPVWFFACRWVGRKAGTRAVAMCLSAWLIVPLIDIPLSLLAQATAYDWANGSDFRFDEAACRLPWRQGCVEICSWDAASFMNGFAQNAKIRMLSKTQPSHSPQPSGWDQRHLH